MNQITSLFYRIIPCHLFHPCLGVYIFRFLSLLVHYDYIYFVIKYSGENVFVFSFNETRFLYITLAVLGVGL